MRVSMTGRETALLEAFLQKAKRYLEFGMGGSTVLAARHVQSSIVSLDSSEEWRDKVQAEISGIKQSTPDIVLRRVDIGPTGEWGYPTDRATRARWADYSLSVWDDPLSRNVDVFLIDGRFRIACSCEALARAPIGSVVLVHDFERSDYHVIRGLAREIASIERLSVFIKDPTTLVEAARELAILHRFDTQ